MKSVKEQSLHSKIFKTLESFALEGKAALAVKLLLEDEETQAVQEYANTVSIKRLGINDHGPVHMRLVMHNAIIMMGLLKDKNIKTSLENEGCGNFEDSLIAVAYAGMLHDIGMSIGRKEHELHSVYLALPIIERLLAQVYPDAYRRIMVRSLALEGIAGHMGSRIIHSLEAGVVQVADGCDMTKGRARIPMALNETTRAGSIHQYSANSIEKLIISAGEEKPIRIDVLMSSEVGLFQVEEVLLAKIASGTAKTHIELYAQVQDKEALRYL